MKVYLKENSWIARFAAWKLNSKTMALTLGHTIHLYNTRPADFLENKNWVCHELAHVKQFERYGFFLFLARYTKESLIKGYYHNRWEVEARAAEHNHALLNGVTFL
jgi:hypothetical protein